MILAPHLLTASPRFHEFNRLFNTAFSHAQGSPHAARLYAGDEGWTLELDAPGLPRDAFTAEVRDDALHLAITRSENNVHRYRIPLGRPIDAARLTAKLEDGVLTVHLPKATSAAAQTINIL